MLKNQFRDYLSDEKKYSDHTVKAYIKDLEDFELFLNDITLEEVGKFDVKSFLAYLVNSALNEKSINRKLSSLSTFYKFLMLTDEIEKNPLAGIKTLKSYSKIQIPFSENEMDKLADIEEYSEDGFKQIRNRLIIELLYQTGIRKSELVSLELKNIDLIQRTVKVVGKGHKERIIPLNENLKELLELYLSKTEEENIKLNQFLFETKKGKRIDPKFVYETVNSYLSTVTEKNKKSPHMLRHTFATHLLQNGAEINAVKEMLGHSSLASTQVYIHSDIENLKKVFNRAHPRESK